MAWAFWRRGAVELEEIPEAARKRCRAIKSAYAACSRATEQSCSGLETRLMVCYAERITPEQAEAFQQCLSASGGKAVAVDGSECQQEVQALRASLKRYKW
jgi:hypothetical protein